MSKTNFAELSIDAPAERIRISGFRVGDEDTDNDSARDLWRRPRGGAVASDIHRDALTYGYGYGMAAKGRFGAILRQRYPGIDPKLRAALEATGTKALGVDTGVDTILHIGLPGDDESAVGQRHDHRLARARRPRLDGLVRAARFGARGRTPLYARRTYR